VVAAVVVTVTVAAPVVVVELSVTVAFPNLAAQPGRFDAPVGEFVNAQVTVTVPAYPVAELIVTVEAVEPPGLTDAAAAALTAYTVSVTVTVAIPVLAA